MTDTNYLDVGCSTCGHVPQSEKHLCDTTPENKDDHHYAHGLGIKYKYTTPETEVEEIVKSHLLANFYDGDSWEEADATTLTKHGVFDVAKYFYELARTSRDTYWKEQLQKVREEERGRVLAKWNELYGNAKHSPDAVMHGFNVFIQHHHSELDQDITSTTKEG